MLCHCTRLAPCAVVSCASLEATYAQRQLVHSQPQSTISATRLSRLLTCLIVCDLPVCPQKILLFSAEYIQIHGVEVEHAWLLVVWIVACTVLGTSSAADAFLRQ